MKILRQCINRVLFFRMCIFKEENAIPPASTGRKNDCWQNTCNCGIDLLLPCSESKSVRSIERGTGVRGNSFSEIHYASSEESQLARSGRWVLFLSRVCLKFQFVSRVICVCMCVYVCARVCIQLKKYHLCDI